MSKYNQRDIYFFCIVPYVCIAFLHWINFFFAGFFFFFFFNLGLKKVVAGHFRQVVILHSNDCTGIWLGRFSLCCLRVVVLHRCPFEQVWLQYFKLIQNTFDCLMEKLVQIFKCIISQSSAKSLVPPFT